MSHIILECGQGGYHLITVPQRIADDARRYQMEFDKWLIDRSNDHGYWLMEPDEEPCLCYHPPEAFVRWLNESVLTGGEHAAIAGDDLTLLHFFNTATPPFI